jgi:uncharacterized protein (DUF433 family)
MTATHCQWKHLERMPGSSYQQLCVKSKRIWARTLYCEFMNEQEPRLPQQLAQDFEIPLEAVQEAIEYCHPTRRSLARNSARTTSWPKPSAPTILPTNTAASLGHFPPEIE